MYYDVSDKNREALDEAFTYHKPINEEQILKYQKIREAAKNLALLYRLSAPESRELSLAITNLEQSTFWVNAAIARHEKGESKNEAEVDHFETEREPEELRAKD